MKRYTPFLLLLILSFPVKAQLINITAHKQGTMYLSAGYSRGWFSKSDIYLKGRYPDAPGIPSDARGKEYDFILMRASAEDSHDVQPVGEWDASFPQSCFKLGYIFHGENINGIELGFDHVIYTMNPGQTLRVQGVLYDSLNQQTDSVDRAMVVGDNFVHFGYNKGVNYLMLSFVRGMPLLRTRTEMHTINCLVKPGAGVVIPRADVSVYGMRKNNDYHVAGYVAGLEVAFRYIYAEQVFIETAAKGCYANFSKVVEEVVFSAHHYFTSFEWLVSIVYHFLL